MKIKNTTDFSDTFLRRMVSWCCKQIDLPLRKVCRANFTKNSRACRGRAWSSMRFLVRIGPERNFPTPAWTYKGQLCPEHRDRIEALVSITIHELTHLHQYDRGANNRYSRLEVETCRNQRVFLEVFRANRESLLAGWSKERIKAERPVLSLQEKRLEKYQSDLARWQRKAKLAATKIKKLKTKVRYYERQHAARKESSDETQRPTPTPS